MNDPANTSNIYTSINQSENCVTLFLKSIIKKIIVDFIKTFGSNNAFTFGNEEFDYFIHEYNTTWLNERKVEIPIALSFIHGHKDILEVGNVLSHYVDAPWDIIDKFEKGKRIVNADVTDFRPKDKYGLIVSISTLEHVGFDDDKKDTEKIVKALLNLKNNCLEAGGKMIVTLPIGYNKEMDKKLFSGQLVFNEIHFLKRVSKHEWKEAQKNEIIGTQYGHPFSGANSICVGLINK
jgi:hypothetical protein